MVLQETIIAFVIGAEICASKFAGAVDQLDHDNRFWTNRDMHQRLGICQRLLKQFQIWRPFRHHLDIPQRSHGGVSKLKPSIGLRPPSKGGVAKLKSCLCMAFGPRQRGAYRNSNHILFVIGLRPPLKGTYRNSIHIPLPGPSVRGLLRVF